MRIIIVGASGVIGGSLYAAAKAAGNDVVGTGHSKSGSGLIAYDMRVETLRSLVPDLGPGDVVHLLSGYSNPSWIFDHQAEARELNLVATKRLIDEVLAAGARLIFMSSVEVFDGETGNYREESPRRPLNLYGRMKAEIEDHIAAKKAPACVVRTGWNVGWTPAGRCVVKLTYESLLRPAAKMALDNTFSIVDAADTGEGLLRLSGDPSVRMCHLAAAPALTRTALADLIVKHSRRRDAMGYRAVAFSEIAYSEPRGRRNEIDNSRARSILGMTFRPAEDVVRQKIKLLDEGDHG